MKEVNISYFQKLLDIGRFNISDRKFYQSVLNSIKKQGGKATDRQYSIIKQIEFGKTSYSSKNEHIYNKNNIMDQISQLRQLIKESIQEYIRDIDAKGNKAALKAKMEATQEAIDKRKKLINKEGLDEAFIEYLDERKMKEMTSEIKQLEKSLGKYDKQLKKMEEKNAPKMEEMKDDSVEEEIIDEVTIDPQLEELTPEESEELRKKAEVNDKEYNIAEMLLMQKRAGIISETEYAAKLEELEEAKKKPSAGLTKKQKSAISKKAHAGKDIGKKGKGFEKVAKAAEKQYGSKEAGERVAAAAMWKNIKRK